MDFVLALLLSSNACFEAHFDHSFASAYTLEADSLCSCLLPRVVVLDHHKTSAAELTDPRISELPNLEVHFDMSRSGATVAYDYFQPEVCS